MIPANSVAFDWFLPQIALIYTNLDNKLVLIPGKKNPQPNTQTRRGISERISCC